MKRFNILSILLVILIITGPKIASADIGGLTKCSESAAFKQRLATSIKKLEERKSSYELDSPPALALQLQIDRTNARFEKYFVHISAPKLDGTTLKL